MTNTQPSVNAFETSPTPEQSDDTSAFDVPEASGDETTKGDDDFDKLRPPTGDYIGTLVGLESVEASTGTPQIMFTIGLSNAEGDFEIQHYVTNTPGNVPRLGRAYLAFGIKPGKGQSKAAMLGKTAAVHIVREASDYHKGALRSKVSTLLPLKAGGPAQNQSAETGFGDPVANPSDTVPF